MYKPAVTPFVGVLPGPGHARRVGRRFQVSFIALSPWWMLLHFASLQKAGLLPYPVSYIRCKQTYCPVASNLSVHSILTGIIIAQLYIVFYTAMVRFCSGKSTIQLSVADLEKTTGTDAETWQNAQQRSNIQQCNLEFAKESPNGILPWVYINDPKDGMSTHFLGKNKHIPFLMAQAGYNIVSATASETQNTRPGRIPLYDQ